ncbi:MAG: hypothetical protein HYZ75_12020 [Elusimicrobia bacterium]|nr:hypothetical protein [Elusimicrobiota bacterium]
MPRLALALALAFLGPAARACLFCDPAAPVPENPVPDAPFDARVPPGVLESEKAFLAEYEGGRYRLAADHLSDSTLAPTEPGHLLSNEGAHLLFRAHGEKVVAALREKEKDGTLTQADRDLALTLFWERGPMLAERDREFLALLNPTRLGRVPQPEPRTGRGPGGKPPAGLKPAEPALIDRLKPQLELIDHGNPNERAELDLAIARMLESPTAQALAERLIKTGKKVRVSFEPVANSKVIDVNGKKIIESSGGSTDSSGEMVHVRLNRDYLGTDADFRASYLPGTLGHELLGHGLGALEAKKAGVHDTYLSYRDNEAGAGLVGWLVDAERGVKLTNGHMWNYLADPEAYHRGLKTNLPYYAATFSVSELADPLPVLRDRRAAADAAKAQVPEQVAAQKSWLPIIDHFVKSHGLKAESFASIRQDIGNYVSVTAPARETTLGNISTYVQSYVDYYGTDAGKAVLKRMAADAARPFFGDAERELAERRRRLAELTRGKPRGESFAPPAPGQVSRAELSAMYNKDRRENPGHWP